MKRIFTAFTLLLITLLPLSSASAHNNEKNNDDKRELHEIYVNNTTVEFIANDLDQYVGNRPNGVSYPVLKMVFFKDQEQLFIDIMAIDNTWNRLFAENEKILGYFVYGFRLFVVASRGECEDMAAFFFETGEKPRIFNGGDPKLINQAKKNPFWKYSYRGAQSVIVDSGNQELLNRRH